MNKDTMKLIELIKELEEVWEGSGHSTKGICRTLENLRFAWDKPFEESVPRIFFGNVEGRYIVINVTVSNYELLQPLELKEINE